MTVGGFSRRPNQLGTWILGKRFLLGAVTAGGATLLASSSGVARQDPNFYPLQVVDTAWARGVGVGAVEEEFGRIAGAAFDSTRNIYLLDIASHSVRVFDVQGAFQHAFGRSGRGPGEFAEPRTILHDGIKTLYIVDSVNGLLQFQTTSNGIALDRIVRLPIPATDVCFLKGRLFAYGLWQDHTVHEISADGRLLASFGALFGPEGNIVQRAVSTDGHIACLPDEELIVVTTHALADIRAYRANGYEPAWSDSLRGFQPVRIQTDPPSGPPGSYVMYAPPDGHDEVRVLHPLGNGLIIAQARRAPTDRQVSEAGADPFEVITSCFIVARTGECRYRTTELPLLQSITEGIGLAVEEIVFPRVRLLTLNYGSASSRETPE